MRSLPGTDDTADATGLPGNRSDEFEIQEVISPLVKGKIVLEIAHRMRTVKNADQIIVLDGGVVADYDQVVWSFIVKEKCIERLAGNIKSDIHIGRAYLILRVLRKNPMNSQINIGHS